MCEVLFFFFICLLIWNQTLVLNSVHPKLLKIETKVGFHLTVYAFILSLKHLFSNFFFQCCCLPPKATVILETATFSLVSSPLVLTTNPALRVVSSPHAYALTRRITVFFFFLVLWRWFFSLPWPQALKREVFAPPLPASSFNFICSPLPEISTIFWTFFFFLRLLLFWDSEPGLSISLDLDLQVLFLASKQIKPPGYLVFGVVLHVSIHTSTNILIQLIN